MSGAPTSASSQTAVPAEFLSRIVETLHPVEIWLFGSRARGDFKHTSDWDLIAVVPDEAPDSDLDVASVWRRLRDLRLQRVDVLPVKQSEFQTGRQMLGTLAQIATSEGVRVYER